jgi:hypothetical protein
MTPMGGHFSISIHTNMAKQAKAALKTEALEAVADRGYFNSPEILACHEAGITVTLPKPLTSGAKADGRFGQAGLCLFVGGRRLSLSGWGAAAISLYKRRRRQDAAAILDHSLSKLFAQIAMHVALSVLAYNLTRVMNIVGIKPLIAAIAA